MPLWAFVPLGFETRESLSKKPNKKVRKDNKTMSFRTTHRQGSPTTSFVGGDVCCPVSRTGMRKEAPSYFDLVDQTNQFKKSDCQLLSFF